MADKQASPLTSSDILDLRNGTALQVFTVHHTSGNSTLMDVEQTAVSCAVLGTSMVGPVVQEATESVGITLTNDSATDGVKEVTIASGVATGIYTVVVRFAGSGAGIGSTKL
jgi:hypothetical protein